MIEENFDINFGDKFVRKTQNKHVTSQILESDTAPANKPPQVIINDIDFDSLFGPIETALDSKKIVVTKVPSLTQTFGPPVTVHQLELRLLLKLRGRETQIYCHLCKVWLIFSYREI